MNIIALKFVHPPHKFVHPQHFGPKVEMDFSLDTVCAQNLVKTQPQVHRRVGLVVSNRSQVFRGVRQDLQWGKNTFGIVDKTIFLIKSGKTFLKIFKPQKFIE